MEQISFLQPIKLKLFITHLIIFVGVKEGLFRFSIVQFLSDLKKKDMQNKIIKERRNIILQRIVEFEKS